MYDMPPNHAKPPVRKDHLWVLFIIAGAAAIEVCASWVGIGALSGFPIIRLPFGIPAVNTDFSLMVGMEAYSGYALYRWLACGDGRRARPFAMWSAITALALSLIGQISYHVLAASHAKHHSPYALVGFVAALPVLVVMLAAILLHLVHLDREEAEAAAEAKAEAERRAAIKRAEADERTALRAELAAANEVREANVSALRKELEAERTAHEGTEAERAEAVAKAETTARKLETITARNRRGATARKRGPATGRKPEPVTGPATGPLEMPEETAPDDLDSEAKVLWYLAKGHSASKAGVFSGLTDSRGRQIARLAKTAPTDTVDGGQTDAESEDQE